MKRKFILVLSAALLACGSLIAQDNSTISWYKEKYEQLVRNLGPDGVGVETVLNKWARLAPEDPEMLEGRFKYYFTKSQSTKIIRLDRKKYLGEKPVLSLTDSTGKAGNFFQVTEFSDSLFNLSVKAIDLAIALCPEDIRYRCEKISALMAYEKEEPDMAVAELYRMMDYNKSNSPAWTINGEPTDPEIFEQAIQEYCVTLYNIASPSSLEYFKAVTERMIKLYPKNPMYLDNMGSYWKTAKHNDKKALGYYKKALKLDPNDRIAKMNIKIIQP